MATTEADIVNMAMRLSGTGAQVGLTESDIMALSATMSSVGISAEAGGTAMSTVMKKISNAVADGGKGMDGFAKAAGMSSEDFSKAWENDPITALDSFIKGLAESGESGENLNAILGDLGIKGIQETDTLLRLTGASELLSDAVDTSSNAWDANSALTDEAAQRYETFQSKIDILKNNLIDLAMQIGDVLLPAITWIVEKVTEFIGVLSELNPVFVTVATVITIVVAALALIIGPILLLIGFLPSIIAGFAALKVVALAVAGAIGAISLPVVLVVAGIAALIAILVYLWNTNEGFRDGVIAIWESIKEAFSIALNFIKEIVNTVITEVRSFITDQLSKIKEMWDKHGTSIMAVVTLYLSYIWNHIKMVMGIIMGIFQVIWAVITTVIKVAWRVIKTVISTAIDIVMGVIDTVMSLIKGDWESAWESIKETAGKVWDNIIAFFDVEEMKTIGKDLIMGLIKGISSMLGSVATAAKNIAQSAKDAVTNFFQVKSPSRVMMGIGVNLGEGLANGMDNMQSSVAKSALALSKSATINPDMTYATPDANYGSLSAALSGEVNVNQRDSALIGAIASLESKLTNLRVEMDGQKVGSIVTPHVNGTNAVNDVTRYF